MNKWKENILALVDKNDQRANEIIAFFVKETPIAISQIKECLLKKEWNEAAAIVHKISPRFSYLGADSTAADLYDWESSLRAQKATENEFEILERFETITSQMIAELVGWLADPIHKKVEMPLAGKTILVAEDDEINALVFELFAKELGCDVIKVTDGNQAVKATLEKNPDLIFMDVHMPFFSGLDAIRTIRGKGIECPIISLSASTRLNEKQNSLDAGANDFLVKPAKRENITTLLLKYLS